MIAACRQRVQARSWFALVLAIQRHKRVVQQRARSTSTGRMESLCYWFSDISKIEQILARHVGCGRWYDRWPVLRPVVMDHVTHQLRRYKRANAFNKLYIHLV